MQANRPEPFNLKPDDRKKWCQGFERYAAMTKLNEESEHGWNKVNH